MDRCKMFNSHVYQTKGLTISIKVNGEKLKSWGSADPPSPLFRFRNGGKQ
jgi:hypothetical protein